MDSLNIVVKAFTYLFTIMKVYYTKKKTLLIQIFSKLFLFTKPVRLGAISALIANRMRAVAAVNIASLF